MRLWPVSQTNSAEVRLASRCRSANRTTTIEYNKYFNIGGVDAYVGFDIEHIEYADEVSSYIAFTQGGAHTSTYESYYDEEYNFISVNLV